MRLGWFTPTEATDAAVAYGLFVGMVIHRSIGWRVLYSIFREAAEISAVIMLILGAAGIFSYAINTLGVVDPIAGWVKSAGLGSLGTLALVLLALLVISMFIDGVSIFLIFVPLLYPVALAFRVEDGVITGRVKDAAVAGNSYELLRRIRAVGSEARWVGGVRHVPPIVLDGVSVARR